MLERIEVAIFQKRIRNFLVLDVRSPQEFNQGHIPGAVNLPLFSDPERSMIGALFHHQGREAAIIKGLDICLPKTSDYLIQLKKIADCNRILLYCWRGGMRSALMAEVFTTAGYDVEILIGGYKSYRSFIRSSFSQEAIFLVLGGFTGSGKTQLLESIARQGEQVVDLEKLANHKGSVFGALGQEIQPTNEQFENNLYSLLSEMDITQRIWIEDESRMLGKITVPDTFMKQILNGIMICLEVPLSARINQLVRNYSEFELSLLSEAVLKLKDRLGSQKAREAQSALESGRFDQVAGILLSYYDQAYQFSLNKRNQDRIHYLTLTSENTGRNVKKLISLADTILHK